MNIKKIAAVVLTSLVLGVSGYFILKNFSNPTVSNLSPSAAPKEENKVSPVDERDNRRINDIMTISNALALYARDHSGRYPIADSQEKISDEASAPFQALRSGGYLKEAPEDPIPDKYYYGYRSDGSAYELTAVLENKASTNCKIYGNYCIYKFSIGEIKMVELKNYTNEKYGYEIEYPSSWLIYDDGNQNLDVQSFPAPKEGGYSGLGGTGCLFSVWIENGKYSSSQAWINAQKSNFGKDLKNVSTEEIEVGEVKGLEVTFSGEFLGSGSPSIIILNKGIIYKLDEMVQDVPQEYCQPTFDQILSTFKFTRKTSNF